MSVALSDAVAEITLLSTAEGGRQGPTPPGSYACVVAAGGQNFDVRFDLSDAGRLSPGTASTVPLRFLDPVRAARLFAAGTRFELLEGRKIGSGRIRAVSFGGKPTRLTAAGE